MATSAPVAPPPKKWLFQANPDRYDIFASIVNETAELWNLNQHSADVQTGDRVLIWASGQAGGLLAVGTVISGPSVTTDSPTGTTYWNNPQDGTRPKTRVLVRYDRVFQNRLTRPFMKTDPTLSQMRVIVSPRGTNFEVTDAEWSAVKKWVGPASM